MPGPLSNDFIFHYTGSTDISEDPAENVAAALTVLELFVPSGQTAAGSIVHNSGSLAKGQSAAGSRAQGFGSSASRQISGFGSSARQISGFGSSASHQISVSQANY